MNRSCVECGRPIEEMRTAYVQVIGYVKPKTKDNMIGRRDTGNFICEPCVVRIKAGLPVGRDAPETLSLF